MKNNCKLWHFRFGGNYWGTCFGHAFSKAYQYVTIDENIYKDLTYVYIKTMQKKMQKCKMWPQIFGKCEQSGRRHMLKFAQRKLNTLVKKK
jgi:hypothetical protein